MTSTLLPVPSAEYATLTSPGEFAGAHCESSAMRKVLLATGTPVSEALLFGLGGGIGFWYTPAGQAGRNRSMTSTRNGPFPRFILTMGGALGLDLVINRESDPVAAEAALAAELSHGVPVICYVDMFHLPYFQASRHFGGHAVVVFGIDPVAGQVWLSDRSPRPMVLSTSQFAAARGSQAQPFPPHNAWLSANWAAAAQPTEAVLRQSIRNCVAALSQTSSPNEGHLGLQSWGQQLTSMVRQAAAPDVIDSLVAAFIDFEFAGTGGGGFRYLYRTFLQECQAELPEDLLEPSLHDMDAVCAAWQHLTDLLIPAWGPASIALRNGYLQRQQALITGTEQSLASAAGHTAAISQLQAAAAAELDGYRDQLSAELGRAARAVLTAEQALLRHLALI